ncbi:MAG: GreA/GreB family elongation factor [Deltaproteobacteria bacterium]|nr:MAG: GreA/GreB family elongation factor [Deltaproteobacteria bacterium]
MSKAFTRESDDVPEPAVRRLGVAVPEPNYMTPAGAEAARRELAADRDVAGLGASVTIEDASGRRTRYRLVGALEADARRGLVFWQSPLAEALWEARVGDTITLPRGGEAEVVAIDYE